VAEGLAQDEADPRSLQRETTGLTAVPREACRRAGISPQYTLLLDGEDPIKYILSANIHRRNLSKSQRALLTAKLSTKLTTREAGTLSANIARRHLTKGQRAVAVAKVCSFSEQTQRQLAEEACLSRGLIGSAATVLKHASDLADSVLNGSISLDNAYAEASGRWRWR
jgi:hypothetical protein